MKKVRRVLASAALLFAAIAVMNAQGPKPEANSLPKTLTVKEVLALINKAEVIGQACGEGRWNGQHCTIFMNGYASVKLPWDSNPHKDVRATFAQGNYLIEFSGTGFRYSRLTDVPNLTLKPPAEAK